MRTRRSIRACWLAWVCPIESEADELTLSQRNGWRTSLGSTPANLDLFLQLEREMEDLEVGNNVKFGFWHVPRHLN